MTGRLLPDDSIYTFEDAQAVLAQALPGYEPRRPQQILAEAIEGVFFHTPNFTPYTGQDDDYSEWERPDRYHFLGQAGCGTGKSLSYLIPAILSGKRVVVSVTTKALQEQIVSTDLPFLEEHLGHPFSWALLKGRSNYLCLNRLGLLTENDAEPAVLRALWTASQNPTFTGQREEIPVDIPDRVWWLAASESEECSANKCNETQCYAERARNAAAAADLVIANHALFFTDLMMKSWGHNGMLGEYALVVFDEAHMVEEVAGNTLGSQITEGSFNALTAQVRRWGVEYADDDGAGLAAPIDRVTMAASDFFRKVTSLFEADQKEGVNASGRIRTTHLNAMVEEVGEIYSSVELLRRALADSTYDNAQDLTKASQKRWRYGRALSRLLERLSEIIAADPNEIVRWMETETRKNGEKRIVVKIAPIHVWPFLRQWLFTKTPTVLVSATLAVRGSMDYIAGRLGIDAGTFGQVDVGTPFDFKEQGRLYVPVLGPTGEAFPDPKSNPGMWEAMSTQEIHRLVTASRGRALVLFTSVKHMKSTFEILRQMQGDLAYRVQGERGASNQDLINWLKDHETGGPGRVLLATKSFFTGIDVPGDALSMLIITKMPFPVPSDPPTEARCDAIEMAGGSSFNDYSVPVMSLELQQGLGRLIRHRGDRGVAAILDNRIVNKGYGKRILRDLPPMPHTFNVEDIATFFEAEGVPA